jgi:ADP-ribosylglycohydrolase
MRNSTRSILSAALALIALPALAAPPRVTLNKDSFRDRVYACFLGKNIGGTLGMPVEGSRETHDWTFYTPVPAEPAANDDLDLQLLWLKALQECGPQLNANDLGRYWLKYVPVDWAEYGVGKANMRVGFMPPTSGQIRNKPWRDSDGAWIRSEIWACLAPGCPWLAARYAWQDACVDHGTAEGTWAEMFTASVESAAFVESDTRKLIDIGLSYVPDDSALERSIRAAIAAYDSKLPLMEAREAVVRASASTGWFMAPQDVAFVVLGWLYGEGDFGKSICAAVNCGDDTDCTGATLGSILGIIKGTAGIPAEWKAPVGEGIRNVAIGGFQPPATLGELTDQTVAQVPGVLEAAGLWVSLRPGADEPPVVTRGIALVDMQVARGLWARSPWRTEWRLENGVQAALDYGQEPALAAGGKASFTLELVNTGRGAHTLALQWMPAAGLKFSSAKQVRLEPGAAATITVQVAAGDTGEGPLQSILAVCEGRWAARLPVTFLGRNGIRPDDVALTALGAKATSDSELAREPGCTPKAIDGIIADQSMYDENRWHSALTPHPHWLAIDLGRVRTIHDVIVHFADPAGHPVDFDGEASLDGATWTSLFNVRGYTESGGYATAVPSVKMRHFRLTLRSCASPIYRDAAQVSEVQLLGR